MKLAWRTFILLFIVIIIIIRHYLGHDRPVSASSNGLFRGLPSRLRPFGLYSALFLASCCCSFLLRVAVNLICVSLVSFQPVLLSTLPNFSHSFCGQTMCVSRCSSEKFHLDWCQSLFILLSGVPNYVARSFSPAVTIWVYRNVSPYIHNSFLLGKVLIIIIIIINIKDWTLWSVPSPEL